MSNPKYRGLALFNKEIFYMATYRLSDREQLIQDVQSTDWDMIVVGGGITGAGVLREAAREGLKVLLLEQQDFAWGTSSRSSKMVHGGLRYLAMGDIALTKHSLHERERLLREAPGLVERMGYYFLLNKRKSPPKFGVKIVLWLYDIIAGVKYHRSIRLPELQEKFKTLSISSLKAAFYYTDAITDDSRLVQRVLQEAIDDGGAALNYSRVAKLLQGSDGEVQGVVLEQGSELLEVRAKVVVNATGAWADVLRQQVQNEKRVRPLRGSHLVVDQKDLPVADALALTHPQDNRSTFIFPWENRTVIGTTDLDHTIDLDVEANISAQEVNYLLELSNSVFPDLANLYLLQCRKGDAYSHYL
jgi:glycerol-3-phosphate dehydrogenase